MAAGGSTQGPSTAFHLVALAGAAVQRLYQIVRRVDGVVAVNSQVRASTNLAARLGPNGFIAERAPGTSGVGAGERHPAQLLAHGPGGGGLLGVPGLQQLLGDAAQGLGIGSAIDGAAETLDLETLAHTELDRLTHWSCAGDWRNGIGWIPSGRSKDYPMGALVSVSRCNGARSDQRSQSKSSDWQNSDMRLSWPEHLQTARALELSGDEQRGTALALMGVALLLLSQDLLAQQLEQPPAANDTEGVEG